MKRTELEEIPFQMGTWERLYSPKLRRENKFLIIRDQSFHIELANKLRIRILNKDDLEPGHFYHSQHKRYQHFQITSSWISNTQMNSKLCMVN